MKSRYVFALLSINNGSYFRILPWVIDGTSTPEWLWFWAQKPVCAFKVPKQISAPVHAVAAVSCTGVN